MTSFSLESILIIAIWVKVSQICVCWTFIDLQQCYLLPTGAYLLLNGKMNTAWHPYQFHYIDLDRFKIFIHIILWKVWSSDHTVSCRSRVKEILSRANNCYVVQTGNFGPPAVNLILLLCWSDHQIMLWDQTTVLDILVIIIREYFYFYCSVNIAKLNFKFSVLNQSKAMPFPRNL